MRLVERGLSQACGPPDANGTDRRPTPPSSSVGPTAGFATGAPNRRGNSSAAAAVGTGEDDRVRRSRRGGLLAIAVAAGLLLAACGGAGAGTSGAMVTGATGTTSAVAGQPKPGGTLTVALDGAPDTLDPQKSVTIVSNQIRQQVYERLIQYDASLQNFQPMLATSWDHPNPLTYIFHLRQGVKFSNGQPFTADDVVFTYQRLISPEEASPQRVNWSYVKDVKKIDDYTVEFDLNKPFAPFLTTVEAWQILPHAANVDFSKQMVGTGPFVMKEWVPNDHITLVKNPDYWDKGHPYLDQVVFKFIPDPATRIVDLQTGAVDLLNSVPFDRVQELQKDSRVKVLMADGFVRDTLGFNVKAKPFDNPLVRKAVALAIDRDTIAKTIMFGFARPTSDPIVPGTPWYDQAADQQLAFNLSEAKQLLQQAGLGQGFSTTIKVSPTYPQEVQMAQLIQQDLAQIGIQAKIEQLEWSTWVQQVVVQKNFDIEIVLHSSSPGPDSWTYNWLHTGGSVNLDQYSNPQMDQLLDQARQTDDQQQQIQLYDQVQQLFAQDVPWTNIDYEKTILAEGKAVEGFVGTGRADMNLRNVWLTK
jgi:peptide/nickel transport system substrate-binding protein